MTGSQTATASPYCTYLVAVTDTNLGGGGAPQTVSFTTATPTTTTVASSLNPSTSGQNVTFTATVTGTGSQTGTVNFTDGGSSIGCALQPVSAGTATCNINTLAVSPPTHSIVAAYSGDGSNQPSSSSPLAQVVNSGGGGGGSCNGFAATHNIPLTWTSVPPGSGITVKTVNYGGFGKNDAVVISFTTPSGQSPTQMGNYSFVEYGGPPANRWYKLSTTACDFAGAVNGGTSVENWFTLGPNGFGAPVLQPNTQYFLNLHNDASCGSTCNIIFTLQKPYGL